MVIIYNFTNDARTHERQPLGTLIRKWEDNIEMDLRRIGYEDVVWIDLARCGDKLQFLCTCYWAFGINKVTACS